VNPPADFDKFASVVKPIAMHYNQGWDDGLHYGIMYWEFWNEPEIFWSGTPGQCYSLYEKTARALKSVDPTLKIGGDAKAFSDDGGPYLQGFLDYCAAHKLPLDFYSWHTYADGSADPDDAVRLAKQIRGVLDTHGFPKAESILSEWNLSADFTKNEKQILQGAENAAYIGAALNYLRDALVDHAQFYRGDAAWMGLFDVQGQYFKTAYTFKAAGTNAGFSEAPAGDQHRHLWFFGDCRSLPGRQHGSDFHRQLRHSSRLQTPRVRDAAGNSAVGTAAAGFFKS
jgi:xylan 1,4-beta-xylosidase